jgi:hypothetical protein
MTPQTKWDEKVTLIEKFEDWQTTLDNLRAHRQAIIDKINSDSVRSAGGLANVTIDEVRAGGPIGYIYNRYIADTDLPEALPDFVSQLLIIPAEEF